MIPSNTQQIIDLGFKPDLTENYLLHGREMMYESPYSGAIIFDSDRRTHEGFIIRFVSVKQFFNWYTKEYEP